MEIFKVIKEYPQYSVSSEGRILNKSTGKILNPSKKPNGYLHVNLFTGDGRRKKEYVHRLVAITFLPNESRLPEVNHIDGVRDNNVVGNLEWVSRAENVAKSSLPKKVNVYASSGELVETFDSIVAACDELGLTNSNVAACLHGRQKTHRGYTFKLK